MSGASLNHDFLIDGAPPLAPGDEPSLYARSIMGDYFGVMGISLRAGRRLTDADREDAPLVGVVNEAMVRRYFPNSDPIGHRVRWARMKDVQWITIVGVAGDVRHFGLTDGDQPAMYTPFVQAAQDWKRWSEVVVRGPGGHAALEAALRRSLHAVDPLLPITSIRSVDSVVSESLTRQRFGAELLSIFAGAALGLSCVGIFGVMWAAVRRRRAEIGVRMALGAAPGRVVRDVLGDGLRMVALGIGIGLAVSLVVTRWMGSLLVDVPPTDPATFGSVAAVLAAAALLACWIPARVAAKTDPMTALRSE